MASNKDELLKAVEDNYIEAIKNEPRDLAAAETIEQVVAIQSNVATAKAAYFKALAAEFTATNDSVQTAFAEVKKALALEKECRKKETAIADVLDKLVSATSAVQKLVKLAKG